MEFGSCGTLSDNNSCYLARAYMRGLDGFKQNEHYAYVEARRAAHWAMKTDFWWGKLYERIRFAPEGWYLPDGRGPYLTQYEAAKVDGRLDK